MDKTLITALALSAFAITAIPGQAQAQPGYPRCLKAPKDPIPCRYMHQTSPLPKPPGK